VRKLPLWHLLDEIDAALEAFAGTPDEIRELGLEELTELVRFQDEMEGTARRLKNQLHAAAAGEVFEPRAGKRINSLDHPVLVKLRKKLQSFRDLALKILHTNRSIN
jgi:hypothetical protein